MSVLFVGQDVELQLLSFVLSVSYRLLQEQCFASANNNFLFFFVALEHPHENYRNPRIHPSDKVQYS
jgi:hypothetical protein